MSAMHFWYLVDLVDLIFQCHRVMFCFKCQYENYVICISCV